MTKYEKLEAEYNALETPEQQWAWVLAHKDEVKLSVKTEGVEFVMKNSPIPLVMQVAMLEIWEGMVNLLSVLDIEAEEV